MMKLIGSSTECNFLTLKNFCGIKEEKFAGFLERSSKLYIESPIKTLVFIFE